jgi:hypothetical protein
MTKKSHPAAPNPKFAHVVLQARLRTSESGHKRRFGTPPSAAAGAKTARGGDALCYDKPGQQLSWEGVVQLIFYYVGFMVAGDFADYFIGLAVERVWPQASLITFLALYFVSLWIAWLLAVKLTEPKASKQVAR